MTFAFLLLESCSQFLFIAIDDRRFLASLIAEMRRRIAGNRHAMAEPDQLKHLIFIHGRPDVHALFLTLTTPDAKIAHGPPNAAHTVAPGHERYCYVASVAQV
jgi:hypothetical protein